MPCRLEDLLAFARHFAVAPLHRLHQHFNNRLKPKRHENLSRPQRGVIRIVSKPYQQMNVIGHDRKALDRRYRLAPFMEMTNAIDERPRNRIHLAATWRDDFRQCRDSPAAFDRDHVEIRPRIVETRQALPHYATSRFPVTTSLMSERLSFL